MADGSASLLPKAHCQRVRTDCRLQIVKCKLQIEAAEDGVRPAGAACWTSRLGIPAAHILQFTILSATERRVVSPCPNLLAARSAFTFLELLLTLAILAITAAFAWPALDRPLAEQRLQKAAEAITAAWIGARVDAIESGQTCRFSYTPGGNRFRIERDDAASALGAELNLIADAAGLAEPNSTREETLPDGVLFYSEDMPRVDIDRPAPVEEIASDALSWSEPLAFEPDGSSADFRVTLRNQYGTTVEVSLRGLTGVATIGERLRAEDAR